MATVPDSMRTRAHKSSQNQLPATKTKTSAQPKRKAKALRAESLTITDSAGRDRIVLGVDKDGTANFRLFDAAGRVMVHAYVTAEGDGSSVEAKTPDGLTAAELSCFVANDGVGYTRVAAECYRNGYNGAVLEADEGRATFKIKDDNRAIPLTAFGLGFASGVQQVIEEHRKAVAK